MLGSIQVHGTYTYMYVTPKGGQFGSDARELHLNKGGIAIA